MGPNGCGHLRADAVGCPLASLQSLEETETLRFYLESDYSYDDAAALADFWGDATPYEAKLRIERNLILGHADEVEAALQLATR